MYDEEQAGSSDNVKNRYLTNTSYQYRDGSRPPSELTVEENNGGSRRRKNFSKSIKTLQIFELIITYPKAFYIYFIILQFFYIRKRNGPVPRWFPSFSWKPHTLTPQNFRDSE